jgi:hypothetical protein
MRDPWERYPWQIAAQIRQGQNDLFGLFFVFLCFFFCFVFPFGFVISVSLFSFFLS